jgi:hypothetical protein
MPCGTVRAERGFGRLVTALMLAAVLLATAACGTGPGAGGDQTTASARATEVFFPQQRQGGELMMAEISGKLILDDEGCLRLEEHPGHADTVPVWPAGFELDTSSGEVRVLDEEGRVAARVGKEVYVGGGGIPKDQVTLADEQMLRELFERCPGQYWIVGSEVRMLDRQG